MKTLAVSLALSLMAVSSPLLAQDETYDLFSSDQLDNLLAPIALYPDPLLAQVLIAATFPDQIDEAARFVRYDPNAEDVDSRSWDVSVKAVAHYPAVVEMMSDKLDWTISVGQAYVNQSTDVMTSVQRLRGQAQAAGNLVTTPEIEVVDSGGVIELWPAQPEYIWVPVYDPAVIYFRRAPLYFRTRFFIGVWLNYDFDWRERRVFYHGWGERGPGWAVRSRPFIRITDVYVRNDYRDIHIDRDVARRRVNYRELDRYNDVHRKADFDRYRQSREKTPPPPPKWDTVRNKIIDRNVNTNDPRLNEYRGHPQPSPSVRAPEVTAFAPAGAEFGTRIESDRGRVSRLLAQPPPPKPAPQKPPQRNERKRP